MKILFCDLLFQKGNKHVDNCMIDIMSKKNHVYVLMNDDFLSEDLKYNKNVIVLGNNIINKSRKTVRYAIEIIRRMILAAKYDWKLKPDLIYISTYKTSVFPLCRFLFRDLSKVVIVENDNIDLLRLKRNEFCYSLFANKVHHIVYEPLFKEYLLNRFNIHNDLIHIVPHIQYSNETIPSEKGDEKTTFDCIAISGSNDSTLVREIIELEKCNHLLKNNNITCRIKCKDANYTSENLLVSGDFIDKEEYEKLYANAKVVLVPFPHNYQYRMSGCIVDAFSNHKPVVSSNITLSRFYASKYGSIIKTTTDIKDMLQQAIKIVKEENSESYDFSSFFKDHGKDEVTKCLNETICKISNM